MTNYTLTKKRDNLNQFKVVITGDYNDGDYSTRTEFFSKDDFEKHVLAEVKDLRDNYSDDYKLREFEAGWLWLPSGDNEGCHTLESIEVEYIDKNGDVWDVNF